MTPQQKLKWAVIKKLVEWDLLAPFPGFPAGQAIDSLYEAVELTGVHADALEEVRSSFDAETGLECDYHRNYESKAVAARMPDGSWVGWTYYDGGGKHSEPGEIPWMEDAYDLECAEEEKTIVVRTFSRPKAKRKTRKAKS